MKRKTNKTKEEAWSQTAHAPDGEQPGPEASDTSGQSVPKSKFRKKSQQEQAAAAKLHMESQGEKLEQAREKLAKQLGISEHQLSYITHSNSGEGLLFYGNVTIPFVDRFPRGEIYDLLTTRPEDMKNETKNE